MLTTHFHLGPGLRISGALCPLPPICLYGCNRTFYTGQYPLPDALSALHHPTAEFISALFTRHWMRQTRDRRHKETKRDLQCHPKAAPNLSAANWAGVSKTRPARLFYATCSHVYKVYTHTKISQYFRRSCTLFNPYPTAFPYGNAVG